MKVSITLCYLMYSMPSIEMENHSLDSFFKLIQMTPVNLWSIVISITRNTKYFVSAQETPSILVVYQVSLGGILHVYFLPK
jgi:hypothetical protein